MSSRDLLGGVAVGAVLVALGGVLADRLAPTPVGAATVQPVIIETRSAVEVTPTNTPTTAPPTPKPTSTPSPSPSPTTTAPAAEATTSAPKATTATAKKKRPQATEVTLAPVEATTTPTFRAQRLRVTQVESHRGDRWRHYRWYRGGDHRRGR